MNKGERGDVNPADGPAPFWDEAPASTSETGLASPAPVSLGILPAAAVDEARPQAPLEGNNAASAVGQEPRGGQAIEEDDRGTLSNHMESEMDDEESSTVLGVLILALFGLVWIGATQAVTVLMVGELMVQHETRNWQETSGLMQESWVTEQEDCSDEGCSTEYCVNVRYTYGYGNLISGDQLSTMEDCYSAPGLAERMVERYPAGAEVSVYHHPDDMYNSILEPGLALRYMWMLLFLVPFQLVSLGILYLFGSSVKQAVQQANPRP